MNLFNIIKLDATTSTNDILKKRHYEGGCKDCDVVWTEYQIKGRGQREKQWVSEPNKNLTFSIYKVFEQLLATDAFLISQAVTLGIFEFLQQMNCPKLKIKWPNDMLSEDAKIGGVLIENILSGNRIRASVVGIGINVNQTEFNGLPFASSLQLKMGTSFNLTNLLNNLLDALNPTISKMYSGESGTFS